MPRVSQEVAKQTRAKIIEVSLKIITIEGGENLTFSNIAKKAEISRSGINCHFKRKEDLIEEIRPIMAERINQALDFSSPSAFFNSWKDAVDNDRMFRNLIKNIGYIVSDKDGFNKLKSMVAGDEEETDDIIYKSIGYAVVNID